MISTGNVAVDMVGAALAHYKKYHKMIKTISLSHKYWAIFSRFAKERHPELVFEDSIEFNNAVVRKGHAFMKDNMEVELYKIEAEA